MFFLLPHPFGLMMIIIIALLLLPLPLPLLLLPLLRIPSTTLSFLPFVMLYSIMISPWLNNRFNEPLTS